jgi:hypothetical protein
LFPARVLLNGGRLAYDAQARLMAGDIISISLHEDRDALGASGSDGEPLQEVSYQFVRQGGFHETVDQVRTVREGKSVDKPPVAASTIQISIPQTGADRSLSSGGATRTGMHLSSFIGRGNADSSLL